MSDPRILAFLDAQQRETATPPMRKWGGPEAPFRQTQSSVGRRHVTTSTSVPQPYLRDAINANVRAWFEFFAEEWHRQTAGHSSMTLRKRHPAYQEIINLGWPAVPMLLAALKTMPDMWFPALREITNENPVDPADRGDYEKMAEAWRTWGRHRNLIT